MPTFTVKLPIRSAPANFARRTRTKAGLSALYVRANSPLPGPDIFKGLSSFFTNRPTVFPGPNIFTSFARKSGLSAFRAQVNPTPVFPGRNIFAPFLRGARGQSHNCASCPKACSKRRQFYRRGMGQDDGLAPTYSVPSDLTNLVSYGTAPTYGSSLDLPTEVVSQASTLPRLSTYTYSPSTNPALDAFNQALTNAQAKPTTVGANLNPSQLTQLSNLVASATPTQLATAAQGVSASTLSSTLTGFFNTYGTYLLLAGVGIFAIALLTKKKGR